MESSVGIQQPAANAEVVVLNSLTERGQIRGRAAVAAQFTGCRRGCHSQRGRGCQATSHWHIGANRNVKSPIRTTTLQKHTDDVTGPTRLHPSSELVYRQRHEFRLLIRNKSDKAPVTHTHGDRCFEWDGGRYNQSPIVVSMATYDCHPSRRVGCVIRLATESGDVLADIPLNDAHRA